MKNTKKQLLRGALLLLASGIFIASGQGLDPAQLLKPLGESWPTYSGDYSGRRYSSLTQIDKSNVSRLTLAWTRRYIYGTGAPSGTGPVSNMGASSAPLIVGGEGSGDLVIPNASQIKGTVLFVDGILYLTMTDNAWALDARDGHELWHYFWKTRGGTHTGNRGAGIWHNYLFMETPDNYLVSLNAKTGKERWHKEISSFTSQYFTSAAPVIVGNHVLVGTGNDMDAPGFLQSFDPESGELQWKHYTVPMNPGDPGIETWKSLDAARHGGAQPWMPGSYDPETHLYIFGTGNPTPAYVSQSRGEGDNLFTCSLVAVNVDTGKMAWYYQTSPHDTHDWDSVQTPVLVDADFDGHPRKLLLTASRNGFYFTLDRTTGVRLASGKFAETLNWAKGMNNKGQPIPDPMKESQIGGALVSGGTPGAANWPPATFSPDTGLFYTPSVETYAMFYLTDPKGAMGLGGKDELSLGLTGSYLTAIDYKTAKIAWRHKYRTDAKDFTPLISGLLSTAGKLLFTGDPAGNLVAFDPANGDILWHSYIGRLTNAPQTYMFDQRQYLLAAAGDTLFAFTLPAAE